MSSASPIGDAERRRGSVLWCETGPMATASAGSSRPTTSTIGPVEAPANSRDRRGSASSRCAVTVANCTSIASTSVMSPPSMRSTSTVPSVSSTSTAYPSCTSRATAETHAEMPASNPGSAPGARSASGDQRSAARSITTVASGVDSCSSWRTMSSSRWAVARQ
jgi:hypothetical protein